MAVNEHISDLFFNRDFEHCVVQDKRGMFNGWNDRALKVEAATFLNSLSFLDVQPLPSVDELLADFYRRV